MVDKKGRAVSWNFNEVGDSLEQTAGCRYETWLQVLFAHRRTLSENSVSTSSSKSPRSWTKVEVPTKRSRQPFSQRGAATGSILNALMQDTQRRARKTNNESCGGRRKIKERWQAIYLYVELSAEKIPNKLNLVSVLSRSSGKCLNVSALKHSLQSFLTFYHRLSQSSCLWMKWCLTLFWLITV